MGRSSVTMMKGAEARVSSNFVAKPNGSSPICKGVSSHMRAMRSRGQFYLQLKVHSIWLGFDGETLKNTVWGNKTVAKTLVPRKGKRSCGQHEWNQVELSEVRLAATA
jgi:hypothetical protein